MGGPTAVGLSAVDPRIQARRFIGTPIRNHRASARILILDVLDAGSADDGGLLLGAQGRCLSGRARSDDRLDAAQDCHVSHGDFLLGFNQASLPLRKCLARSYPLA